MGKKQNKINTHPSGKWMQSYLAFVKFYNEHNGQFPKRRLDASASSEEYVLARWVATQKYNFKNNKLGDAEAELLSYYIPLENDAAWFKKADELLEFCNTHNRYPDEGEQSELTDWFDAKRAEARSKKWETSKNEILRQKADKIAQIQLYINEPFYTKLQHLDEFITKNKRLPNINIAEEKSLALWIRNNQTKYKANLLPQDKYDALLGVMAKSNKGNIKRRAKRQTFEQRFKEFDAYVSKHKRMPSYTKPKEKGEKEIRNWFAVAKHRYQDGKLSAEDAEALSNVFSKNGLPDYLHLNMKPLSSPHISKREEAYKRRLADYENFIASTGDVPKHRQGSLTPEKSLACWFSRLKMKYNNNELDNDIIRDLTDVYRKYGLEDPFSDKSDVK